jgi:hypothetical protein
MADEWYNIESIFEQIRELNGADRPIRVEILCSILEPTRRKVRVITVNTYDMLPSALNSASGRCDVISVDQIYCDITNSVILREDLVFGCAILSQDDFFLAVIVEIEAFFTRVAHPTS